MTLARRREFHVSVECYKQVNNTQSSLHHYFQQQESSRTRTGDKKLKVPDLKTTTGRRSFSYRGPVHWNSMPEELKSCESVDAFKRTYLNRVLRDVYYPE